MIKFHTMAKDRPEMKMLNNSIAVRKVLDQKYDTFEQVDVIVNREIARYPENALGKEIYEPESLRKHTLKNENKNSKHKKTKRKKDKTDRVRLLFKYNFEYNIVERQLEKIFFE